MLNEIQCRNGFIYFPWRYCVYSLFFDIGFGRGVAMLSRRTSRIPSFSKVSKD